MIGLLLPLWQNLESGGALPDPVYSEAPPERYAWAPPEVRLAEAFPAQDPLFTGTIIAQYRKATSAAKDYRIDWSPYLQSGETITSTIWSVSPSGLTVGSGAYDPSIDADGKVVVAWLQGGTVGVTYFVTCQISTINPPHTDDRDFTVTVESNAFVEFRKVDGVLSDYTVNFDSVLEPDGERLASVTWTAPPGITLGTGIHGQALSPDLRKSNFWLQGGTVGSAYVITGHYVTDHTPPREDDVRVVVVVSDA